MVAVQKPSSPFFAGYRWLSKNPKTTFWASGALMRNVTRRSGWIRGYSAPWMFVDAGTVSSRLRILSPARGRGQKEGQQASEPHAVHRWISRHGRFKSHFRSETQMPMLITRSLRPSRPGRSGRSGRCPFTSSMLAIVLLLPGRDGQVADLLPAELERQLRARDVLPAVDVGEVDAVLQLVILGRAVIIMDADDHRDGPLAARRESQDRPRR